MELDSEEMFAGTAVALVFRVPGAGAAGAAGVEVHAMHDVAARDIGLEGVASLANQRDGLRGDEFAGGDEPRVEFLDGVEIERKLAVKIRAAREIVADEAARA